MSVKIKALDSIVYYLNSNPNIKAFVFSKFALSARNNIAWLIQSFIKDNHPKYKDYVALWFRNLTLEQKEGFKAQYERAMYNSLIF